MDDYRISLADEIKQLQAKAQAANLPPELLFKIQKDLISLERSISLDNFDEKYEKVSKYIDWILKVPWNKTTADTLDIEKTKTIFEKHHFGMQEVKDRFLEFVSVLKLRSQLGQADYTVKAPILLLVGLVGTGKTTFAYSLAEALGRKLIRIPFGGLADAVELRGRSRLILGSEPGRVIKGICESQVKNPVILLDEIDRVAEETRMDIMGVLVELLDPAQNHAFMDSYLDYPVDLSQAVFIATANNTTKIVTAVLDRMEKITMPSYSDEDKIVIAKKYILPQLLKEAGMTNEHLIIQDEVWPSMVRPLGYDAGIRTLQRTLQGAVRKAARILVEKGYPNVVINVQNAKIFLPQY